MVMTLVEKLSLTGKFTIKKIRTAEKEIFSNPFLREEYNFPPDSIRFYGYDDGFSKLKEEKLPVDENLDLISNLENLKNKGLIEDYSATPAIKENDIFIDYGKYTFELYKLVNYKTGKEKYVNKEIYTVLKNKKSLR